MAKINKKQLAMGMKVEQEHKDVTHGDKKLTKKIAVAHLKEVSDYYTKLKMVENPPKKESKMAKMIKKEKMEKKEIGKKHSEKGEKKEKGECPYKKGK